MTKIWQKIYSWKNKLIILDEKLQFPYPSVSIKDIQAPREAFGPQKRTSSTSKHEISKFFSTLVGHFCLPGSGSGYTNLTESKSGSGSETLILAANYCLIEWRKRTPDPLWRPRRRAGCCSRCSACLWGGGRPVCSGAGPRSPMEGTWIQTVTLS